MGGLGRGRAGHLFMLMYAETVQRLPHVPFAIFSRLVALLPLQFRNCPSHNVALTKQRTLK